ncbi:ABC transporter permease [Kineosporia babensis]|uniref:ABC transporter permease n=1 Tax=Kineosporia babensis TaxID=499548 RepID=A0A9X1SSE4_9ACTN|nr:ABC transporter permease subunit [Kineosporia babensis]MCD5310572.1 ABC transporter permease [Kineosporia babensis]
MSTTAVTTRETSVPTRRVALEAAGPIRAIPLSRVVGVELRKMFDTRSGFWLMASIAITATLATVAVIVFAPDSDITYTSFAGAVGFPMSVILPVIAILAVTSEYSQRSGLTTFTLVPHRGRVITAKAIAVLTVAVFSMVLAMLIGVLGNIAGSAIAGVDTTWDSTATELLLIVLGNTLGMLVGFMLGVLIRNSAGAIVGYFVFSLVLPGLSELLAANASWYADRREWLDFNYAQGSLFGGSMTGEQWANLGVTSAVWLVLPLAIGLGTLMRSEVK